MCMPNGDCEVGVLSDKRSSNTVEVAVAEGAVVEELVIPVPLGDVAKLADDARGGTFAAGGARDRDGPAVEKSAEVLPFAVALTEGLFGFRAGSAGWATGDDTDADAAPFAVAHDAGSAPLAPRLTEPFPTELDRLLMRPSFSSLLRPFVA